MCNLNLPPRGALLNRGMNSRFRNCYKPSEGEFCNFKRKGNSYRESATPIINCLSLVKAADVLVKFVVAIARKRGFLSDRLLETSPLFAP